MVETKTPNPPVIRDGMAPYREQEEKAYAKQFEIFKLQASLTSALAAAAITGLISFIRTANGPVIYLSVCKAAIGGFIISVCYYIFFPGYQPDSA